MHSALSGASPFELGACRRDSRLESARLVRILGVWGRASILVERHALRVQEVTSWKQVVARNGDLGGISVTEIQEAWLLAGPR